MQFAVERRFRQKIVTKQIHCLKCCETTARNFIHLQIHTFLKTSSEKAVFYSERFCFNARHDNLQTKKGLAPYLILFKQRKNFLRHLT